MSDLKRTLTRAAAAAAATLTGTAAIDAVADGDFSESTWLHIGFAAAAAGLTIIHDALTTS